MNQVFHNLILASGKGETLLISGAMIVVGIFLLIMARSEAQWFWNNRKARFVAGIFGDKGARIFYGLMGTVFIVMSIFTIIVLPEGS